MLGRPEQRALLSGYEASSILNLMFQMILAYYHLCEQSLLTLPFNNEAVL